MPYPVSIVARVRLFVLLAFFTLAGVALGIGCTGGQNSDSGGAEDEGNASIGDQHSRDHTSGAISPQVGHGEIKSADDTLHSQLVMTAKPVDLLPGTENQFRDGPFLFASQPAETDFAVLADLGFTVVINLRPDSELAEKLSYDEAAAIEAAGLQYVQVPITLHSFSPADVKSFADALASLKGPALIHCSSSNRVGAMWAAYLARERDFDLDTALERGRAAGLTKPELELRTREVIEAP